MLLSAHQFDDIRGFSAFCSCAGYEHSLNTAQGPADGERARNPAAPTAELVNDTM